MALEDICSFWYNEHLWSPSSLLWPSEEVPTSSSTSGLPRHHLSGWGRSGNRDDGPPLRLIIPPSTLAVQHPFPLTHGTTTLAFVFQGGVIVAADTRASAGGLVACPESHKIKLIHSHLVATSSGSSADCVMWVRLLQREIRLYRLRHGRLLSVRATAKLLAFMLHPFKGTEMCVALTLCGWDQGGSRGEGGSTHGGGDQGGLAPVAAGSSGVATTMEALSPAPSHVTQSPVSEQPSSSSSSSPSCSSSPSSSSSANVGPKVIFVCSDGTRLQGELFSVGSGSPYAYSILDTVDTRWTLSQEEAILLGREAVFRATHRDAYSGNNVDVIHITESGWSRRKREDLKEEYYRRKEEIVKRVEERRRMAD